MDRRTFLKLTGASVLFYGCEGETEPLGAEEPKDGGTLIQTFPDASAPDANIDAGVIDAGAAFVISEAFEVILNDTLCSKHSHSASVRPAIYTEDTPVHFLGGSHEVVFLASELVQLQNNERIPFATMGEGPSHGHCGMAWRLDFAPEDRTRMDACMTRGTAMCLG